MGYYTHKIIYKILNLSTKKISSKRKAEKLIVSRYLIIFLTSYETFVSICNQKAVKGMTYLYVGRDRKKINKNNVETR